MAMKLLIMNAFYYRLCHLVPAHCSACKHELYFLQWCKVLQVCLWLHWEQLNRCVYTVCNIMDTKAKDKILNMQRYSIQ